MATMASPGDTISNDTRGWILCAISAIACVAGACIVCVDVFIRLLPGKKSFNIQDSSAFLSSSLSLSFGVMIFSSLYSMLPSSKRYLTNDGQTDQVAGLLMIGGFALGFVGMQVVSRIIHRFMPSHVVDCDHTHEDDTEDDEPSHGHGHSSHHGHHHDPSPSTHFRVGTKPRFVSRKYFRRGSHHSSTLGTAATESTPLLAGVESAAAAPSSTALRPSIKRQLSTRSDDAVVASHTQQDNVSAPPTIQSLQTKPSLSNLRRPSMIEVRNKVISFVQDVKSNCDEFGPCYGYSDPCGQECKRTIVLRTPTFIRSSALSNPLKPGTAPSGLQQPNWDTVEVPEVVPEESSGDNSSRENSTSVSQPVSPGASGTVRRHRVDTHGHEETQDQDANFPVSAGESSTNVSNEEVGNNTSKDADFGNQHSHGRAHSHHSHHSHHDHEHELDSDRYYEDIDDDNVDVEAGTATPHSHGGAGGHPHHHHVPANAFLSIGLQTVLAIGLHKFPEGFITFATNHANPALGFNVFMALFVHNIAEGFAMALPLYMALGSRLRAILWAAALGGLSQPLGAGMAALWLKYLARNDGDDDDPNAGNGTAYGILFAVTAGIMVAVALQLFVESLTLHHNRQLTVGFAFIGMLLLGLSNAIGTH